MISDIRLLSVLHTCLHQIKSLTNNDTPLHTYPFVPYGIIINSMGDQTKKREEAEGWRIQSVGSWLSSEIRCCEKRMNFFVAPHSQKITTDADASFVRFDVISLFAKPWDDATTLLTLYPSAGISKANGIPRNRRVLPITEYINWSPKQIEQIACAHATCTFSQIAAIRWQREAHTSRLIAAD